MKSALVTIVTLPELPYEQTLYEGPVYPSTLTEYTTVPTIGLVRIASVVQTYFRPREWFTCDLGEAKQG
jgi:hypothetical protein